MIKDYLAAGYPALCVLTHEPHRIDDVLPFKDDKWRFYSWDCIRGVRSLTGNKVADEIQDPVAAVNWLDRLPNTVLIAHNLHMFTDIPEVLQAIQNVVYV